MHCVASVFFSFFCSLSQHDGSGGDNGTMCENGTAATTACCEMKRLHVLLAGTGQGMDKGLGAGDCPRGKDAGTHGLMKLRDTLPHMQSAINLYEMVGSEQFDKHCLTKLVDACR